MILRGSNPDPNCPDCKGTGHVYPDAHCHCFRLNTVIPVVPTDEALERAAEERGDPADFFEGIEDLSGDDWELDEPEVGEPEDLPTNHPLYKDR